MKKQTKASLRSRMAVQAHSAGPRAERKELGEMQAALAAKNAPMQALLGMSPGELHKAARELRRDWIMMTTIMTLDAQKKVQ